MMSLTNRLKKDSLQDQVLGMEPPQLKPRKPLVFVPGPKLNLVLLHGLLEHLGEENRLGEVVSKITRISNKAEVDVHRTS
jgi:hypothetical protein